MLFLQKQCLQCCGLLFSRTVKLDTRSRAQHLHHNNIYFKTSKPHSVGPDWRSCCDPRPKWWLSQSLNSPKGNSLIRTSFASPGASGLFFRSQLSKLPRQEIEVVSIEVFTFRISQQFFILFLDPFSFTEGFAEFIRLAFKEFTMFFRARLSAVQSLSPKLLGKLLYVDTLTLH